MLCVCDSIVTGCVRFLYSTSLCQKRHFILAFRCEINGQLVGTCSNENHKYFENLEPTIHVLFVMNVTIDMHYEHYS